MDNPTLTGTRQFRSSENRDLDLDAPERPEFLVIIVGALLVLQQYVTGRKDFDRVVRAYWLSLRLFDHNRYVLHLSGADAHNWLAIVNYHLPRIRQMLASNA